VLVATAAACAVNVAVELVAVTELGTVTALFRLYRVMTTPPDGKVPDNATVQESEAGPVTVADVQLSEVTVTEEEGGVDDAGFSVSVNVCVTPEEDALTWTVVTALTAEEAEAVKVALFDPPATVTEPGTLSAPLSVETVTDTPLVGADALILIVQVVDPGAVNEDGLQLTEAGVGGGISVTVALDDTVLLATEVAVTVTACCVVTVAGAVYRPVVLTVPAPEAGVTVQVTEVFDAF